MFGSLKCYCNEGNGILFYKFYTDSRIKLSHRIQFLKHVEGDCQGYQIAFPGFLNSQLTRKNIIILLELRRFSFI